MPKSIAKPKVGKPYRDFPLTPHPTGRWCKRINNKLHYFGYIKDGWQKALDLYQQQRDDLYAGRVPRASQDGLRLHELVNRRAFPPHGAALPKSSTKVSRSTTSTRGRR